MTPVSLWTLHVLWEFSASIRITGAKNHPFVQMNVAEVNKVMGRSNWILCGGGKGSPGAQWYEELI
uniref:Uncharacterized protein n=1 Tax=Oryctolagus cuniculus TaxID=9986 RepID=A0A5F9DEQ8_RABIT